MSYGLQVTKSNGNILLTEATRLSRLIDKITITIAGGASTNLYYTGISKDNTWGVSASHNSVTYPGLKIETGYIHIDNTFWATSVTFTLLIFRL
jgi:hypothetical protein